jgi:hypothetical protein
MMVSLIFTASVILGTVGNHQPFNVQLLDRCRSNTAHHLNPVNLSSMHAGRAAIEASGSLLSCSVNQRSPCVCSATRNDWSEDGGVTRFFIHALIMGWFCQQDADAKDADKACCSKCVMGIGGTDDCAWE